MSDQVVQTTWAYSDFHPSKWLQIFIPPHGRYASSSKTGQYRGPATWYKILHAGSQVAQGTKNELTPVKLGFSLFWMSQCITCKKFRTFQFQAVYRISDKFWPIHWNITQAKLRLQNANYTETASVEMIGFPYPHGFTDTNGKKTQILTSRNQYLNKSSLHEKTEIFGAT